MRFLSSVFTVTVDKNKKKKEEEEESKKKKEEEEEEEEEEKKQNNNNNNKSTPWSKILLEKKLFLGLSRNFRYVTQPKGSLLFPLQSVHVPILSQATPSYPVSLRPALILP